MTFEWSSRDRRSDVQTSPCPQTAEWHLGSRLPISHQPIKGIHVARGNGRDQLAFDLSYWCTQLHLTHQGARKRWLLQRRSCSSSCLKWWMDFLRHLMSHAGEVHTRVVGSPPHASPTKMQRGWPLLCRQRRLIVSCWRMYRRPEEPSVQPFPVCQWLSCGAAVT